MVLKKQQYIQCICLQNNSTTRGVSNQSIRPFIPTPYSQAAHNNSQPSICNHSIPLHIKSILNPAVKTAIKSQSLLNSFIRIEAKSKKKGMPIIVSRNQWCGCSRVHTSLQSNSVAILIFIIQKVGALCHFLQCPATRLIFWINFSYNIRDSIVNYKGHSI